MAQESPAQVGQTEEDRRKLIARLRRLEGQIRGLQSMIEQRRECEEILTQLAAAKVAMNQVGLNVIAHAMKECLRQSEEMDRDRLIDDALEVFLKYVKCVQ
ncbi:MAG: transcriptional regulator [Actinobacteria bacterium]|nr:MAG: transcriptional regulator [Actinomycetota bacterium]